MNVLAVWLVNMKPCLEIVSRMQDFSYQQVLWLGFWPACLGRLGLKANSS